MYICAREYAFMTVGGPFLDSQQSFQCVFLLVLSLPGAKPVTGTKPCTPISSSVTVGCVHDLRHGYTETGIKLVAFLTYPLFTYLEFGNAKSVLGL